MFAGSLSTRRRLGLMMVCMAAVLLVAGCQQLTPEERLIEARSKYEATLNNFIVTQAPLIEDQPADEDANGEEGQETEGKVEVAEADPEAEGELVEEVPVRQDVTVDLTIRHESAQALEGITVDFYMSDGDREIENWKVWFDTTEVPGNTPGVQFSHTFEDVDYQEGYGFAAEIRSPVPAGERGEYREFSEL